MYDSIDIFMKILKKLIPILKNFPRTTRPWGEFGDTNITKTSWVWGWIPSRGGIKMCPWDGNHHCQHLSLSSVGVFAQGITNLNRSSICDLRMLNSSSSSLRKLRWAKSRKVQVCSLHSCGQLSATIRSLAESRTCTFPVCVRSVFFFFGFSIRSNLTWWLFRCLKQIQVLQGSGPIISWTRYDVVKPNAKHPCEGSLCAALVACATGHLWKVVFKVQIQNTWKHQRHHYFWCYVKLCTKNFIIPRYRYIISTCRNLDFCLFWLTGPGTIFCSGSSLCWSFGSTRPTYQKCQGCV